MWYVQWQVLPWPLIETAGYLCVYIFLLLLVPLVTSHGQSYLSLLAQSRLACISMKLGLFLGGQDNLQVPEY
jgi:hypothetical protein